jgi:hypothetical protein
VVPERVLKPISQEQASHDGRLVDSSIWVHGRQDAAGIRWEQWQRRFRSASCEGDWRQASKLATSHQDELHRVGTDHEDQVACKESLGGHRARGCHATGRPNGVGRQHQRGATGDAGIAGGEGDRWQRGCPNREGVATENGVRKHLVQGRWIYRRSSILAVRTEPARASSSSQVPYA